MHDPVIGKIQLFFCRRLNSSLSSVRTCSINPSSLPTMPSEWRATTLHSRQTLSRLQGLVAWGVGCASQGQHSEKSMQGRSGGEGSQESQWRDHGRFCGETRSGRGDTTTFQAFQVQGIVQDETDKNQSQDLWILNQPKSEASSVSAVGRPSSHGSDRRRSRSPERKWRHGDDKRQDSPRRQSSQRDRSRRESKRSRPSSSGGSSSRRRAESGSVSKASDTRPSASSSRHHHHSSGDHPFHQLHLGRLPTAGLCPVTREDERVPIGRVRRTSPDLMSTGFPRLSGFREKVRNCHLWFLTGK